MISIKIDNSETDTIVNQEHFVQQFSIFMNKYLELQDKEIEKEINNIIGQ